VSDRLVYATRSYESLADQLCREAGGTRGTVERHDFPDGERMLRLATLPAGRDTVVLGGTISDAETLELYDLACGRVEEGARSLTLAIPYFGYSTMERASRRGEVVTGKTRARLFSCVPAAPSGNAVVLLDVHSEGLPYYFEGNLRKVHLSADDLILDAARREGGPGFVLASADAGRAKRVQHLANRAGVAAGFVFKRRVDSSHTALVALAADVGGKTVVLYDDMIRTGSSLLGAARAYRDAGASDVTAVATHGLFPGDALARLRDSGLLRRVVCTDSHPRAVALQDGAFLVVESIAPLLAQALC
jgi:ribose-phosphate pyrophosphokinase